MSKYFSILAFCLGLALIGTGFYLFNRPKVDNKITQLDRRFQDVRNTIVPIPTVIQADGLPNKHLIQTTFIPQAPEHNWDQPWQDACEEASLLTVDYYYKKSNPTIPQIKQSLLDLIEYETSQGYGHDIDLAQMSQIAKDYLHYKPHIINNPTIDDLKQYIAKDIPIVVPASGKILFKENKNFRQGGPDYHNLTILGYDDTTQQFIVHDVGTRKGAYFRYSYTLLIESVHDLPADHQKSNILNGQKSVLVLLQ